jgi:hypothetical protein
LTPRPGGLYIVHMKTVTASEARRSWFRLLDEAAQGEVIVVRRKGRRLLLRREDPATTAAPEKTPPYRRLLRARDADHADRWSWEWRGPHRPLASRKRPAR